MEAAERAFDVGVEEAEQLVLRDQRHDEARALRDVFGAIGAIGADAQARGAAAAGLDEPGREGRQQRLFVFAARQQRAGELPSFRRFEHQQHALGAAQFGRFVDEEFVQRLGTAQFVEAQPGIDQPLERLAEIGIAGKVRFALFARQPKCTCVRQPGDDDLTRDTRLAEEVAAQPFVAQARNAIEHEAIGLRKGRARVGLEAAGPQGLAVAPPEFAHVHFDQRCQADRAVQLRRAAGRGQGGAGVAGGQVGPAGGGEKHHQARVVVARVLAHGAGEVARSVDDLAVEHRQVALQERPERLHVALRSKVGGSSPRVGMGAGGRRVAEFDLGQREVPELDAHHALRFGAPADAGSLSIQTQGTPMQPERDVSRTEVVDDGGLAQHGTRGTEHRKCLVQALQPQRQVHAVEGDERLALADQIAAALRQGQRLAGSPIGLGRLAAGRVDRGLNSLRTPLIDRVAERFEDRDRARRVRGCGVQCDAALIAGFGEAREAEGFEGGLAAAACRAQRGGGGCEHRGFAATALERDGMEQGTGFECRVAPAPRECLHFSAVGGGSREVAGDDEVVGPQVEQVEALAGAQALGLLQRFGGQRDGLQRVPAPGQLMGSRDC